MTTERNIPVLYLVIPCYNEEAVLPETTKRLTEKMHTMIRTEQVDPESRILYVDDGSKDKTWAIISEYAEAIPYVDGVKLAHNRGHQNALLAGLMTAMPLCDCAISMDADLQDDINVIDRFVEKYMEGCDVVYGVRNKRETDTFFKRTTAEGFYKFMKILGVDVVFNHADYRLMSRRALEGLSEYKEVNLFLRGIVPLIGFKSDYVYYDRAERFAGESKYPLKKMISFALDGITSFSVKPLKLISNLGILISVLSIFGLLYALISHLCGVTVAGWTAIVASIWLLGGIQLLCIGVCGEYIGKIYSEVKARPRYHEESSAATSAKFTAKSSSAPVSSSKPTSKPNRKKKSWTNTDTLTKPDPELSRQFGISFPAAHGMLSLRGTFYEKIRFRSFQIFPRLRFRLRFCIAPVFYAMYIRQKADISALKYRSASVRYRLFCAVSVSRPPATGQAFVASADRIVRCAHILSVSAFIFRTALYFL